MTTTPPDSLPSSASSAPSAVNLHPRIGHGYDLHRLEPDLPLVVGGVKIDHDRGCAAHSDGDVVYHAVTDAILGALGQDDIGQLFPDNDPKWKDADSHIFFEEAVRRMGNAGYALGNLDITVILERPKLSPHKAAIRQNLDDLLILILLEHLRPPQCRLDLHPIFAASGHRRRCAEQTSVVPP